MLRHDTSGATKFFVDALVNDVSDLVLKGQDVGAAPMAMFGDSDYEYWVTVPADQKDRVLLELMVFAAPSRWGLGRSRCGVAHDQARGEL